MEPPIAYAEPTFLVACVPRAVQPVAGGASLATPRLRVALRLSGFIEHAHAILQGYQKDGRPAAATRRVTSVLVALRDVISDEDSAIHAAQLGVHVTLAALANAREADDADADVPSAASDAIVATVGALPPGWGFPRRRCLRVDDGMLPQAPFVFPCGVWAAQPPVDADLIRDWLPCEDAADGGDAPVPSAFLRVVPSWVHRLGGQEHVGQLLWPAAVILSRWIAAHRAVLQRGRRVLEIGSGPGLTGIVAGLCMASARDSTGAAAAAPVVLSDFEPFVLRNLRYNAALNAAAASPAAAGAPDGASPHFAVERLDWTEVARADQQRQLPLQEEAEDDGGAAVDGSRPATREPFDVIVGSDIVCCASDAALVAATIAALLRRPCPAAPRGGVALLCFPPLDVRYGVDALPPALWREGLWHTRRRMHAAFTAGGSAAALATAADLMGADAARSDDEEGSRGAAEPAAVGGGHEASNELWVVAHAGPRAE